jgi:hypothetical protein
MGYVLPSPQFTAIAVGDTMHMRDALSSEHGLSGRDASLMCQVTRQLTGLPWRGDNAELLQQAEHVKVHPIVGHPAIYDTKDARAGDVNCFASR